LNTFGYHAGPLIGNQGMMNLGPAGSKGVALSDSRGLIDDSRQVALLDHQPLPRELTLLERHSRPQRSNALVDHPTDGHDDYANVTCLAVALVAKQRWR
jgi:hypothetical protein